MALANVNNQKRQVLSGLLAARPVAAVYYGDVYYATDNGLWYIYTPSGWVGESAPVTLSTLPASEAHIGEVGCNTSLVVVTPDIGAAAFTIGDFVGGKLTLANAGRVAAGSGIVQSLSVVDAAKQNASLRIYLFKADLAGAYADNAVESFTLADMLKLIDVIDVSAGDWETLTNCSVTRSEALRGLGIPYKITSGTSLFAIIRTLAAPTFTADCLQLTFGLLRD